MTWPSTSERHRALHAILRWQTSHAVLTVAAAVGLAVLAMFFTAKRLEFQTSQSALISSGNRLMQRLEIADRFSRFDAFVVAVENRHTGRSLEFVRALAPRLEADDRHFAQVFSRVNPTLVRPWALLYLKPAELVELRESFASHESFIQDLARKPGLAAFLEGINGEMASSMVGEVFTSFLKPEKGEGKAGPADLDFLVSVLREMKGAVEGSPAFTSPWRSFLSKGAWEDEADEGYLWTEDNKYLLLFVAPVADVKGAPGQGDALLALRQAVSAVREKFPDVEAGVTGQKALDEDEKSLAVKDMGTATLISLSGLAILLVSFWRSLRRPMLQLTTQVVGLSITFGLTTLLIGHLNLLSVTFAPMVLGLGMDYDIHWFSRYDEERRRPGISNGLALRATMEKVGPAIVLAALATGLAFFPLALAGFKGLGELGIICGIGLIVASGATLFLLPALTSLFERAGHAPPKKSASDVRPLLRMTKRRALLIVCLSLVATGFSLWGAQKTRFDLNMLHLQSKSAESVIWETKLIEGSRYPSIYGVLFARSLGEVAEKTKALEGLPTVSRIESAESFLPADQPPKIAVLRAMEPVLANIPSIPPPSGPPDVASLDDVLSRIRFKMEGTSAAEWGASGTVEAQMGRAGSLIEAIRGDLRAIPRETLLPRLERFEARVFGDLNDKLSLLRENADARPMTVSDLPQPVRERFVGAGDVYVMRVYPAGDIWDPRFLSTFVRDLWSIDADATGDPVTLNVFTRQFRDSSVRAALYSLAFISAFLAFTLRSLFLAFAAVVPLAIGAVWTFGLMYLLGLQLNLANTIFLPLVIGAGVEYGVIIVCRWRERLSRGERVALPFSTGTGVLLAGLTTTIGFGSLMISGHRGIHSLGLLTTIGSLTVLCAALFLLPALLCLHPMVQEGRRKEDQALNTGDERQEIREEK